MHPRNVPTKKLVSRLPRSLRCTCQSASSCDNVRYYVHTTRPRSDLTPSRFADHTSKQAFEMVELEEQNISHNVADRLDALIRGRNHRELSEVSKCQSYS